MIKRLPFFVLLLGLAINRASHAASPEETIARVKTSIVAVGTYLPTRAPQFNFRGTGFVVGDGTLIITNSHVLPTVLEDRESIAVAVHVSGAQGAARVATRVANDPEHDLAVLRIQGSPLPALEVKRSETVREGNNLFFTGYPMGTVLGLFPVTHRAMVSALTPVAIPSRNSAQLDPKLIRRLSAAPLPIFQLDATAYPGSSGSPLYEPDTGAVVGVVNMGMLKGSKETAMTQPSGITYAIPSKWAEALLSEIP
ncbi:MAG TPA: serine protease [Burkholderiales bacterium]|nr:serine protease [Burkholderiales bacterium]